jgi:hypothetical protein
LREVVIVVKHFKTRGRQDTSTSASIFAICDVHNNDYNDYSDECRNFKCLIPLNPHKHWQDSELDATTLCNDLLKSINATHIRHGIQTRDISKIPTLARVQLDTSTKQTIWQDFIKLCCPEDVTVDVETAMTTSDSENNQIYLAKMAYRRKNGTDMQLVPLQIWCLQHPVMSCLLLPANIGLDASLIAQRMSPGDRQKRKEMCIASMVACDGSTDRYIPRANTTRFDFGSQSIIVGNKINTSGACTYSQTKALLNFDNRDFLQSLGVSDLPHVTSCFVHKNMNMYIFINTFRAGDKNYAVHTIYL